MVARVQIPSPAFKIKVEKMKSELTIEPEALELVYGQVIGALAYELLHGELMLTPKQIKTRLAAEALPNIASRLGINGVSALNLAGIVDSALQKGIDEKRFDIITEPSRSPEVWYHITLKGIGEARELLSETSQLN